MLPVTFYPVYSQGRDSLVAQLVKNLPTVQETQVQFLGREDPQRRKWQPTPVFLPGKSRGQGAWWAAVYGVTRVRHNLATKPPPMSRKLHMK